MAINNKVQHELILFGKFISGIVSIIIAFWFFGRAPFNEKVDERIDAYTNSANFKMKMDVGITVFLASAKFKVFVDKVIEDYEVELSKRNSDKVPLRRLLAIKMGVDEDEVHIELGRMFKEERVHFKSAKDLRKRIIEEIKKHHRDTDINID